MLTDCTLLVNTCDSFEDCWEPYFKLLTTYWPTGRPPVVLNTERKDYNYSGVELVCARTLQHRPESQLPWSDRLCLCLQSISTEYVLYMQEDYFVDQPIDVATVAEAVRLMDGEGYSHVGLTHFGSNGPFQPTAHPLLWEIGQRARYRISLQAALWRRTALLSYVRPGETPWELELVGSARAWRRPDSFLTLNRDRLETQRAMNYMHTGIIKGRWHPDVPYLFARHGILVDFGKRGFYQSKPQFRRRLETVRALASNPVKLTRGLLGV